MIAFVRSLFRHFKLPHLGAVLLANLLGLIPFATALVGPVVLRDWPEAGLGVLLVGFLVTGQVLAVSGRRLARRFTGGKDRGPGLLATWGQAWAEGLVVGAILVGLFSLVFQSVPFYWSQGTEFAVFSLVTLGLGSLLVLGFLPYYLPARREGQSLAAAFGRSFRLMNARPGLALAGLGFGLVAVLATVGTLGLFPGFGGLAALHQGLWDLATEKESAGS